jgi:hypothetical protein
LAFSLIRDPQSTIHNLFMKTTFDQLIADTEALESRLRNPADFYQEHQPSYHATAAAVARRVLIAARPEGTPPDRWRAKVEKIVNRVTAHLMLSGIGDMVLTVSAPTEDDGKVDPDKVSRSESQKMTHADIMDWVMAGHRGEAGGKIWKQEDYKRFSDAGSAEKGYSAISTIVMRAYYSRKPESSYVRLRRAIQRYVHGSQESAGEPLLDAIATAWVEHFSHRLPRDLRQHAAKLVREF